MSTSGGKSSVVQIFQAQKNFPGAAGAQVASSNQVLTGMGLGGPEGGRVSGLTGKPPPPPPAAYADICFSIHRQTPATAPLLLPIWPLPLLRERTNIKLLEFSRIVQPAVSSTAWKLADCQCTSLEFAYSMFLGQRSASDPTAMPPQTQSIYSDTSKDPMWVFSEGLKKKLICPSALRLALSIASP